MSSRPPSKLKQLLLRDQLCYQRNVDTIRQAVVDTICKVLAGGSLWAMPASYAVTVNALTPKQSALVVKPGRAIPATRNSLRDSPEITSRFRFTSKMLFFTTKTQSSRSLKEKSFLCVLRAFVVKRMLFQG